MTESDNMSNNDDAIKYMDKKKLCINLFYFFHFENCKSHIIPFSKGKLCFDGAINIKEKKVKTFSSVITNRLFLDFLMEKDFKKCYEQTSLMYTPPTLKITLAFDSLNIGQLFILNLTNGVDYASQIANRDQYKMEKTQKKKEKKKRLVQLIFRLFADLS